MIKIPSEFLSRFDSYIKNKQIPKNMGAGLEIPLSLTHYPAFQALPPYLGILGEEIRREPVAGLSI